MFTVFVWRLSLTNQNVYNRTAGVRETFGHLVAKGHSTYWARSVLYRITGIFAGAICSSAHNFPSFYWYRRWRVDDCRTAHSERRGATSGAWKVPRNSGNYANYRFSRFQLF